MDGFNPIEFESMPVNKWLGTNISIVFRNQTYLFNRFQVNEILSENGYVECSPEEDGNLPMLDRFDDGQYKNGIYYDFKDVGIPGMVCEKSNWEEVVMSDLNKNRFIIHKDEEYPVIRVTPIDENKCDVSRVLTVGIISPIDFASGGKRKRRKTKKLRNKKAY